MVADAEFSLLFREAYPRVLGAVTVIVRDRGRAEELTQDAFEELLLRWTRISRYERPDLWVRRVAIRKAVRDAKREAARPALESVATVMPIDRLPDLDLRNAIAALPPVQRATVALFYLEDLPVEQIASLLGTSAVTVRTNLHRARAVLASTVGEEVTDDVG
jgi:RNA polymerase sigma-70 factor (ECF subfamily)